LADTADQRQGSREGDSVDIKNFGKVNDHIYRGGQPKGDDYRQLIELGVKTIVGLRDDSEPGAKAAAERAGLRYINLPMAPKSYPQADAAKRFLEIVNDARKPVIIHTREAWEDTLAILREHWHGPGGIMHCFTGSAEQAREVLDLGFHLSFGGVATFPRAESVREAVRLTPDDRLLVETDAPYLAPVPNRGKRNEPAFLIATVRKLAEVRATTPESIAQATTRNFERLCLR